MAETNRQLIQRLKTLWRIELQRALAGCDYTIRVSYLKGQERQLSQTDWADLISDCLEFLSIPELLDVELGFSDPASTARVEGLLPKLAPAELRQRLEASDLPVGEPLPAITADPKSSVANLYHHAFALDAYPDVRHHHSWVLLDSLRQAINLLKEELLEQKAQDLRADTRLNADALESLLRSSTDPVRKQLVVVLLTEVLRGADYQAILSKLDDAGRHLLDDPLFQKWADRYGITKWREIAKPRQLKPRPDF